VVIAAVGSSPLICYAPHNQRSVLNGSAHDITTVNYEEHKHMLMVVSSINLKSAL